MPRNQSANRREKIVVILGPTTSGKSDLGIKLAKKFNGEIISADSRQVYRGMDIGTGKVTKKEQKAVKHHLLDIASPELVFTVSDFKKLGQKAINDIQCRYKVPFVVGGTGFYIDALVKDISLPEVPPNKKLRAQFDKLTVELLFEKLKKLDPERAKTVDPKNKRRLIRALEIIKTTGKPVPKLNPESRSRSYDVLWIGLRPKNLEKIIKMRLDKRLKQGMVKEVKNLIKAGVSKKRLHDLGLEYRQISEYLKNQKSKFKNSEYYGVLLREIIKYSKRQMTWFKRSKKIVWLKNKKQAYKLVEEFIKN